ncbi:unnamed protein product [Heterotrigona itama]|uniref:Cysteine/serine-rich nuclear protein N-terminal domain-containing protein n=1 Tax=Heterotrigona itama TaxID=395501 RepID=A0A6V7HBN7_9HYME|nr:unnamed protein product [Heterotrigona itama]
MEAAGVARRLKGFAVIRDCRGPASCSEVWSSREDRVVRKVVEEDRAARRKKNTKKRKTKNPFTLGLVEFSGVYKGYKVRMVTEGRQKPPPPSPSHLSFPASFESIISGQDYMQSPFYIWCRDKKDIDRLKNSGGPDQTLQMESPSAPDCLIEAQEDSTSAGSAGTIDASSLTVSSSSVSSPTTSRNESTERDNDVNKQEFASIESCEISAVASDASNEPSETSNDSSPGEGQLDISDMGLKLGKDKKQLRNTDDDVEVKLNVSVDERDCSTPTSTPMSPLVQCIEKETESDFKVLDNNDGGFVPSSPLCRKRPASDFLPINAEIKRIDVEIPENDLNQVRSDVRRISPVLVSLRERTLGEISLSSDSCLFDDDVNSRCASRNNRIIDDLLTNACRLSTTTVVDGSFQRDHDPEEATCVESEHRIICREATSPEGECTNGSVEEALAEPCKNLEYSGSFIDEDSCCSLSRESPERNFSKCQEPKQCEEPIEECSCNDIMPTNDACAIPVAVNKQMKQTSLPHLIVKMEHVDLSQYLSPDRKNVKYVVVSSKKKQKKNTACNDDDSNVAVRTDSKDTLKEVRCIVENCAYEKNVQKTESQDHMENSTDSPIVSNLKQTKLTKSSSAGVVKECKVVLQRITLPMTTRMTSTEKSENEETGPRSVMEKLETDEKIVFSPSLSSAENLQSLNNLDSSETTLGSPEMLEPTADVPETIDTETETETGSDSSEISAMTSVPLRGCEDDAASDQISCQESSESMCCVDINPEIISRLEPERPEAFTEDSAESLALAAGARDEVRSDGSDSGLGSEIPGDSGPAPVPESDSETSFLDRIPDDILSDKEKAVNQLDSFVSNVGIPSTAQSPLTNFRSPTKSNLKRRLIDCMEEAPSPKRSNTDESMKKKRNIQFDAVTVYYFPRAQGFTCVPSQGGSTLGMSATHTHAERFSLSEHAAEQRRIHRARLAQLRSERAANCVSEAASSSEDPSDDTDEEQSDNEELDIDSYYFLQPVPTWQRRALLRAAGVRRIDAVEKDECRDIRASREHCGCGCKGYCDPESCPCSRANVKCQVELEKKQREEEGADHDASDNQNGRSPLREINLGSVMENRTTESCLNGGGFTTLHYENHDARDGGTNCQPEVPGTREDSLDLYAIRDDCYPSEDTVDGTQGPQRKLHPEFSQAFQTFSSQTSAGVTFQQPTYQDYQPYANLPSTSRVQFQPQFQTVPGNPGFSHYAPYGQDTGSIQGNCQVHPGQHSSNYEASFAQDETTGSQYTNLNSVQPMNTVVQQMGKLEPFSELLSGRYSYYGEMEPPAHGTYHGNGTKVEVEKNQGNEQQSESTEECDENFGEIIKKSMVETVSA